MKLITARSLRFRLLIAINLAVLGFSLTWFGCQAVLMSSQHTGRWDESMQAVGQQVLSSMPEVLPAGSSEPAYSLPAQIKLQPVLMSYQVWLRNGRSVLRSTGSPLTPWVPLSFDTPEAFHMVTIDDVDWRIYTLSDASGQLQVQIGKSQPQLLSLLHLWLGTSVGTVLLLMALLGVVTWFIICWSLGPVHAARDALLERSPLDMGPLPADDLPTEVKPLVEAFNALLLRLEAALHGERRFLADAAHELRTPLAALMAQAQVVKSASTLDESHASLAPLISGIERSARLTEQLLDLARLDAVALPGAQPEVALHEIVSLVVRDYDNTAQAARQRLHLHTEPCHARVDVDAVGVLLRNLLDNALRYAGAGARIEISCRAHAEGGLLLSVRDDGPGVPAAERERIFDRFYRVPGTPGRGSGIGLSLVARIASLHAATLEVSEGLDGRGLGISLRFASASVPPVVEVTRPLPPSGQASVVLAPDR
jgi:two-component system sensor histidine kinase QseC